MNRRLVWCAALASLTAVIALAQVPAAPVAPAGQAPAAAAPQPQVYTYSPDNRRDPFVSLLRRGTDPARQPGKPVEGVGALAVNELVLKGIMLSRSQYLALVQSPDMRTHLVRVNDRLLDGVVRAITADTLVLMQDVNDPLSPTKQREVRKSLRVPVEQK